jgi:hypothetical protein
VEYLLYTVIGVAIGVLSATFGIGGAFILTPVLSAAGMPIIVAIGTSLFFTVGVSAFAGISHFMRGNCCARTTAWAGLFTVLGVTAAFELVKKLDELSVADKYVGLVFMVMLFSTSAFVYLRSGRVGAGIHDPLIRIKPYVMLDAGSATSVWNLVVVGIFIGFVKGFLGVGGGFIMFPMLIWIVGMKPHMAVGTSLGILFLSSVYAAAIYAIDSKVDYPVAMILIAGAYMGNLLGMKVVKKSDGATLTRYFSLLLFISAFTVLFKITGYDQLSLYYSIVVTCLAAVFVLIAFHRETGGSERGNKLI